MIFINYLTRYLNFVHLLSFYITFFILAANYHLVGFKLSYICNVENRNIFCPTLDVKVAHLLRSLIAGALIRMWFGNPDKILRFVELTLNWGVGWFFYFPKLGMGGNKYLVKKSVIGPLPSLPTIRNGRVLVRYVKSISHRMKKNMLCSGFFP